MSHEFSNYLNYSTIFGGSLNDRPVWNNGNSIRSDACYRGLLTKMPDREIKYHSKVTIKICFNYYLLNNHRNNCCFLSIEQVRNYIRQLSTLYPFLYRVSLGRYYRGHKFYVIDIDITATRAVTTVIVQSIKKLYEFPQNFYLAEAYRMQHLPEYRFDNIQNLFMAVASCYEYCTYRDHVFGVSNKFMTIKDMRAQFPNMRYAWELYKGRAVGGISKLRIPRYSDDLFLSNDYFESHLKYYRQNYDKLKV